MNREELEKFMRRLPVTDVFVRIEGEEGHWTPVVVSPDYAHQEEDERRATVWRHILDNLTEAQRAELEFVFTDSPTEYAEDMQPKPSPASAPSERYAGSSSSSARTATGALLFFGTVTVLWTGNRPGLRTSTRWIPGASSSGPVSGTRSALTWPT